jgi:FAD/FMN-containing dehydrogenase
MNKILSIDTDNWFAVIEPGVTYEQLQNELRPHNLRAMIPLGVPPARTVLSSTLERDPALAAASFEYGNDLMLDTELILPEGELFRTGLWASGGRPGSHLGPVRALLYRFWTAAQGTLGIMTKMAVQVEYLPQQQEILFLPFSSLTDSLEIMKQIQKNEIGLECFLFNSFNAAALFCEGWTIPDSFPAQKTPSNDFEKLRDTLPPFILAIALPGPPRLPEEKIAYEKEALTNLCSDLGQDLLTTVPQIDDAQTFFADFLLRPWDILKKFCFKGSVHPLSFKSPLKRIPEFVTLIHTVLSEHNYPHSGMGLYLLPMERGRAVHVECDLHCDPSDQQEVEQAYKLWLTLSEVLINKGALFDRPYGAWADMIYSRTGSYTTKLQELKKELDPNNIMNPGKLCFS